VLERTTFYGRERRIDRAQELGSQSAAARLVPLCCCDDFLLGLSS
jgi:hypothetical protein